MASEEKLLVVVAHPDDETFGTGSLIAHATAGGVETVVACVTRGEAGTPAPGHEPAGGDLGVAREAELRAAAALLGATRVEVFDWLDSGMEGDPGPGTLVVAPIEDVIVTVASLIDDVRPDVVVTLDASDGHRDHAKIRDATLAAVERSSWAVPRVYLQCLPQTLMRRWVAELSAKQPDSDHLALGELGTPEEAITTYVDSAGVLEIRERAMRLHASQVSPYEVMPDALRREFLTVERLCRVRPAWTGGPVETELFAT